MSGEVPVYFKEITKDEAKLLWESTTIYEYNLTEHVEFQINVTDCTLPIKEISPDSVLVIDRF